MLFSDYKGMIFPDDYVTKFFFKKEFHQKKGSVLEIGSGDGNNLMLFFQHGWNTTGIDISAERLENANYNFIQVAKMMSNENSFSFVEQDMLKYFETYEGQPFDVVIMPGSFYYANIFTITKMFEYLASRKIISENGKIFLRFRANDDYRFGKGKMIGRNTYEFDFPETDEEGCINTFLSETELLDILRQNFILINTTILRCRFQSPQNNVIISNSDIIFWTSLKYK